MILAPDQDRALGMDYFMTDAQGCSGVFRNSPDDFQVEEIYENLSYEGGRYLILEIEKKNWDIHHLIREMSRQLRISQKRFSWAGTKDKRALTRQRISVMNLDESELKKISLPDIHLKVLGRTNRAVGLGDLLGNKFRIRIKELTCKDPKNHLARITEDLTKSGGVPNYFGIQRFGDTRPITHKVGEALVRGKVEEAVFIYLALPSPTELERTRKARERLWKNRDISDALKNYPEYLRYERAMLNYLIMRPRDYSGSFSVLATNLRRLFVHAYQSYIFNKILSLRLAKGLRLDRAVEGDIVCFAKGTLPDSHKLQAATPKNLEAINRLAERGRAFVTLPLVGYETILADDVEGEIEKSVLQDERVGIENFRIDVNPDLGSRGARRPALLRVSPKIDVDERCAKLEFFLPAGSYATVLLREYTKSVTIITE